MKMNKLVRWFYITVTLRSLKKSVLKIKYSYVDLVATVKSDAAFRIIRILSTTLSCFSEMFVSTHTSARRNNPE
jgi:hypothetical protein